MRLHRCSSWIFLFFFYLFFFETKSHSKFLAPLALKVFLSHHKMIPETRSKSSVLKVSVGTGFFNFIFCSVVTLGNGFCVSVMRGDDCTYLDHPWEMGILFKEGSKGETCPPLFMGRTWHYIVRLSPMACCLWSECFKLCYSYCFPIVPILLS